MEIAAAYDTILILDFGSQYSHLIARRVRELGIYCELLPCTAKLSELVFHPKGVILSGGPSSVYDTDAPHVDPYLWEMGIPILGICYGLQEMAWTMEGEVSPSAHREFGHAELMIPAVDYENLAIVEFFENISAASKVWMSHGDKLTKLPSGFITVGYTNTAPHAVIAHTSKPLFGIQFHPEVTHTPQGKVFIGNFVLKVCGCRADWTMGSFIDRELERLAACIPPDSHVVGAVSGGVDSTVAAKLMTMAIGDRFHPIFVDNGLLRANEAIEVAEMLGLHLGVPLNCVDASKLFLDRLAGVTDPEQKRKIIGNTFIHVFEDEALKLKNVTHLLQGTLYPDVIESVSYKGPSATIKTHHNVGGLLEVMKLQLVEPLRELFKDEVRALGKLLGLPPQLLGRHPFPGPGLAIRILGEIKSSQLHLVRQADRIFIEELKSQNLYHTVAQAFVVLLPVHSVGVMGDFRSYEQVVCLRAVESTDYMTADWAGLPDPFLRRVSSRIINEVSGINRVVYDISSKPPSTIEWE